MTQNISQVSRPLVKTPGSYFRKRCRTTERKTKPKRSKLKRTRTREHGQRLQIHGWSHSHHAQLRRTKLQCAVLPRQSNLERRFASCVHEVSVHEDSLFSESFSLYLYHFPKWHPHFKKFSGNSKSACWGSAAKSDFSLFTTMSQIEWFLILRTVFKLSVLYLYSLIYLERLLSWATLGLGEEPALSWVSRFGVVVGPCRAVGIAQPASSLVFLPLVCRSCRLFGFLWFGRWLRYDRVLSRSLSVCPLEVFAFRSKWIELIHFHREIVSRRRSARNDPSLNCQVDWRTMTEDSDGATEYLIWNDSSGQEKTVDFIKQINSKNAKFVAIGLVVGFILYHGIVHQRYGKIALIWNLQLA